MKLVKKIKVGKRCQVTIHWNSTYSEYVVRQVRNGKRDSGYFTEDKGDARSTAAVIIKRLRKKGICR